MTTPIRVLVAKAGLDGHDRGAKVIARALRDAGMEVIYTGLHQTPEAIVTASLQEDVDCVAISILSGAHMTLIPKVLQGLKDAGAENIAVLAGGIIPPEDAAELEKLGVAAVHGPGTSLKSIVESIESAVAARSPESEKPASRRLSRGNSGKSSPRLQHVYKLRLRENPDISSIFVPARIQKHQRRRFGAVQIIVRPILAHRGVHFNEQPVVGVLRDLGIGENIPLDIPAVHAVVVSEPQDDPEILVSSRHPDRSVVVRDPGQACPVGRSAGKRRNIRPRFIRRLRYLTAPDIVYIRSIGCRLGARYRPRLDSRTSARRADREIRKQQNYPYCRISEHCRTFPRLSKKPRPDFSIQSISYAGLC